MTKLLEPLKGCELAVRYMTGDENDIVREGLSLLSPDLPVVQAARKSYNKDSKVLSNADRKLIAYLARHKHMSPFRHVNITWDVTCPEFVARQWYKHVVGAEYTFKDHAWNEVSQRYVRVDNLGHYLPEKWRGQSATNKQCSDGLINDQKKAHDIYTDLIDRSFEAYNELLELGVAREQARVVLTTATNTGFTWTASLEACMNFIKLRDHEGSQVEIQRFAKAMGLILCSHIPASYTALREFL